MRWRWGNYERRIVSAMQIYGSRWGEKGGRERKEVEGEEGRGGKGRSLEEEWKFSGFRGKGGGLY